MPVAWFINGGTIGNINESDFLMSVARQAEHHDWLIVSMETLPEAAESSDEGQRFTDGLREKYDQPSVREMLRPALAAVWPYLDHPNPFETALAEIEIDFVDGTRYRYSEVPNSRSVVFKTTGRNKEIVLFSSTRYDERSFIEFAANDGFHHVVSVVSPTNPRYKFLAFEYDGKN